MNTGDSKPRSHFGGIILIFLGLLFLLNNFGIVPWSVWSVLWRAWPVFLIFIGLEAIFGKTRKGSGLLALILILLLGFILFNSINHREYYSDWRFNSFKTLTPKMLY